MDTETQKFINEFNTSQAWKNFFAIYHNIYHNRLPIPETTLTSPVTFTTGISHVINGYYNIVKPSSLVSIINGTIDSNIDHFNRIWMHEVVYFVINFSDGKYDHLNSYFSQIFIILDDMINNNHCFYNDYFDCKNTSKLVDAMSTHFFTLAHSRIAYVVAKVVSHMPFSRATINSMRWRSLLHLVDYEKFSQCNDSELYYYI
jgi:hypothetical protein